MTVGADGRWTRLSGGPLGRRAVLIGGPDVWEVIGLVRAVAGAEPELSGDERLQVASDSSGVDRGMLRTALDYYGEYPDEIGLLLEHSADAERLTREARDRTRALLGS